MPGPTLQSSDLTFLVWGPAIILFFKTTSLRYTLFFFFWLLWVFVAAKRLSLVAVLRVHCGDSSC